VARTQEQRKADTRARLLASAADLFARKGFHAVSAEAVADAADRTTGALYSHFGNKEGLLLALLEEWKEQTATRIMAEIDDPADLDEMIGAAWVGIAGRHDEVSEVWLLLELELWLYGARDPQVGAPLAQRYAAIRSQLADGLVAWSDAAAHPLPAPADELASAVLALLIGAAVQHRLDPPAVPPVVVVNAARRLVGLPDQTRLPTQRKTQKGNLT
jgi:AcrR family transcriptional regulator